MLTALRQRAEREDEGFTLIELMVVVLIIAILLAIAIPTFLGARNSANSRATQSNLRNALTAEQTYYTNNQAWDVTPATGTSGSVAATETSLNWVTAVPGTGWTSNMVLVKDDSAANDGVMLTEYGKDKHCYSIEVINQPGGTVGAPAGTYYYDSGTTTSCASPASGPAGAAAAGSSAAKPTSTWASSF